LGDVWMNEGNLGNILFVEQGVVAIDQKVNAIEHEEGFTAYFKGVQTVVQQIRTQTKPECVVAFRQFVCKNHYEMDDKGATVFQQALLEGIDYICRELPAATLSEMITKHKKTFTSRAMDASFLNEGFLLHMLPAFA